MTMNRLKRRPRPPRYPLAAESEYRRAIRLLVSAIRAEARAEIDANGAAMIVLADQMRGDDDGPMPGGSGWSTILQALLGRIAASIGFRLREAEDAVSRASRRVDGHTSSEWRRLVRESYGVDITRGEPWLPELLNAWEQTNLGLIRSIPSTVIDQLRAEISAAVVQGTSLTNLRTIVRDRLQVADSRADLIARDQVGKLVGQLGQYRQQGIGVRQYVWRTMGDERVRPTHRARNGKTYSWDKPPSGTGHPGHDVRCRCYADPILPEMTEAEVQRLG